MRLKPPLKFREYPGTIEFYRQDCRDSTPNFVPFGRPLPGKCS